MRCPWPAGSVTYILQNAWGRGHRIMAWSAVWNQYLCWFLAIAFMQFLRWCSILMNRARCAPPENGCTVWQMVVTVCHDNERFLWHFTREVVDFRIIYQLSKHGCNILLNFYTITNVPSPCCQFTLHGTARLSTSFGIGTNMDWSGVASVWCVKLIDTEKYEPKGAV